MRKLSRKARRREAIKLACAVLGFLILLPMFLGAALVAGSRLSGFPLPF